MNDRIANLRALRRAEQNAHKDNDLVTWAPTADTIRHALYINCDALLDCAEALRKVTQALEWHAHGRCRGIDDGPLLGTADAVALGVAALARLNGGS